MENYNLKSYLKENETKNLNETFRNLTEQKRKRKIYENSTTAFRSIDKLSKFYSKDKEMNVYQITESIVNNISKKFDISENYTRGYVYEKFDIVKKGYNFNNLNKKEKVIYESSLNTFKRDFPKTNIQEHLKNIVKKESKKLVGINYKNIFEAIRDDNKLSEAEYQGKNVTLNKPFRNSNGSKKFSVYVTDPKDTDNIKKVDFGSSEMEIKRDDPERRKSFRARHKCDQKSFKKDRDKAGYWSCKAWEAGTSVSDLLKK